MQRVRVRVLIGVVLAAASWAVAEGAQETKLFNGENLDGWVLFVGDESADPKTVWSVKDGVIHCAGRPNGYFRTEKKYGNYRLRFDWRWAGEEGGNSGLLLHIQEPDKVWPRCNEAQLGHGYAGDVFIADKPRPADVTTPEYDLIRKKHESNEKPVGEWNTMVVEAKGDTIKVWVNGELQNEVSGTHTQEGYIGFQSEGGAIEFRDIALTPLDDAPDGNTNPDDAD